MLASPPPPLALSPRYTCRTLFERHKLLFSFQMCAKILETSGKLNMDEYNFFLRGGVVSGAEASRSGPGGRVMRTPSQPIRPTALGRELRKSTRSRCSPRVRGVHLPGAPLLALWAELWGPSSLGPADWCDLVSFPAV